MCKNALAVANVIHVWMKGKDYNIYEISVFYDFRLFQIFYKLV